MTFKPRVVDTSHHNTVNNLSATAEAGVWGVIHKATQGSGYRDPDYVKRRAMAKRAGLLWGAYHFNDGSPVMSQVENFLNFAKPDGETLLVFDYEDNGNSNMTIQNVVIFLREVAKRTGRLATIYSGNRLKENISKLTGDDLAFILQHKLWLCQYGATPKLPHGFTSYFLWQFTDGKYGPQPHFIAGISGSGIDLNVFDGTREELEALWVHEPAPAHVADATQDNEGSIIDVTDRQPVSTHSADALQDTTADAADDDNLNNTDKTNQQYPPAAPNQPNVQVPTAKYDFAVEMVQRKLDGLGYHEIGEADGKWGGRTAGAIRAFFNDRGVRALALMSSPELVVEIGKAVEEGWRRPLAPSRVNATPADLAPKVESVRLSLWQRFGAKVAAAGAAVGITGSTLSSTFDSARAALQPVHDAFSRVPPEIWFVLMGLVAGVVWYVTDRAAKSSTKDFNTGRMY